MRLTSILVLGALLIPLALAAPVRNDATLTLASPSGGAAVYISACRGIVATNADPAVELVDDCLTSGVYQESNNVDGLQVRGGFDSDGNLYVKDTSLLL